MADVQLTAALRTTLDATQRIQQIYDRRAEDLATRRKDDDERTQRRVDFVAQLLSDQAADLLTIKDSIRQGASKSQVAVNGLQTIDRTLDQAKALAQEYQNTTDPTRQADLQRQFDNVAQQIDNFARDSSFGGTQLIDQAPDDLTIRFSDTSSIEISGRASDSTTLGLDITDVASIDLAKQQIRASQQEIATDASTLQIRENFTDKLVNELEKGAAKLVEIDLNEAAAQALSAQTRSELAFAATALAAKSDRSILQLF